MMNIVRLSRIAVASLLIFSFAACDGGNKAKIQHLDLPGHMDKRQNRLIREKSPYLLQHAHNPVDWYPWGEEAFEAARRREVPIFLSIGYSTCHWCHVMEEESFDDPQVARLMNEAFVNIKVDREERPDIDNIYMTVSQIATGGGGWPLTIIMTPDKKPFFTGTYIPKESRFGRVGMLELVAQVRDAWKTRREEILESAARITEALVQESSRNSGKKELGKDHLRIAYAQLLGRFDEESGGFGNAPKFPTPHNLLFLLRYWKRTQDKDALKMVEKTLQSMRLGGIYDHVGFGFHRYSTDSRWLVPHFEKMLYDQALLVMAYTEAFQATRKPVYELTARDVLTYVLRDMTDSSGGFYSAQDADSDGKEGKFYTWTIEEIRELLPEQDARWLIRTFQMEEGGNFKDEASSGVVGNNILHLKEAASPNSPDSVRWESIRRTLFAAREKRIHPLTDDKILADWNGLMIAAMAKAGQVLGDTSFTQAAERAASFVLTHLRKPDGELLHRYRQGEAALPAHIDDYAFMVWGLLELYEATFKTEFLSNALELQRIQNRQFLDKSNGGFFFTGEMSEKLIARQKEIYDGAVPSGNSVSMLNLLRLGRITGNPEFEREASRLLQAFGVSVERGPSAYSLLMSALDFAVGPSYEIVIAGDPASPDTRRMIDGLRSAYVPNKVVLLCPADGPEPAITRIAEFTRNIKAINGKATAYVCRNYVCNLPTSDPEQMLALLQKKN